MITIPLPCRNEEHRRTLAAFATSIAFHLLIILVLAVLLTIPFSPPAPPEEAPVELTFIPAPPKPKPGYIATTESQRTEKPPENAPFESDKNTRAAAPDAASGDSPLPSQQGEESPAVNFENQDYAVGPKPQPAQPAAQPQQAAAEPAEQAKSQSTPRPKTDLALLEPPKPKTQPRPHAQKAVPQERTASSPPGYQPQTRISRIRGNISNRGRAAVDAAATPLGKYKKMLSDAIGSRWYYYVNEQISLLDVGTLEVQFVVNRDGKASRIRVVTNSSNESFAACSVRAIMEAEIPPIPKEIVPMLQSGQIEIEYSFTIISN